MILSTKSIGEGSETVVFLHSGLQTGVSDFNHIVSYFDSDYHILLPDLRGHGQSRNDDTDSYFEESAMDLKQTIDNLGIKNIHLVGVSLGALVAVNFALKYKSDIRTLTLSGLMFEAPHNYEELNKQEVEMQNKLLDDQETTKYFDDTHGPSWRKFIEIAKNEGWYPFEDNREVLNKGLPTQILVGDKSAHELETISKEVRENCSVVIIENARHLSMHDNPTDFSINILNFIK